MILTIATAGLNARRRALGMSHAALAARSGVSVPTVKRILGGSGSEGTFANVAAIAAALGMRIRFDEEDSDSFREAQARAKAARLARMVQATSALESQAVDDAAYKRLVDRSYHELLMGPRRRLWSE